MIDEFDYDPNDMGIQRNYTGRTAQATDQPVTPDREALDGIRRLHWQTSYADGPHEGEPCCGCCAWLDGIRKPWPCDTLRALDALTEALDRARRQGKREGRAEAGQAIIDAQEQGSELLPFGYAARLARGGPNRKDEE